MEALWDIQGARVLKTARLERTTPTGGARHFRDGQLQTGFTRLALAQYDGEAGVYIFYCDDVWNCLNDTLHADLAEAEEQAAVEFRGVSFSDA
ncbi:MAG: hypothetical protein ACJ76R_03450 [Solirubrobacteraceae bacterium]